MKKFWVYLMTTIEVLVKWIVSIGSAIFLVLNPVLMPISVGFIAVWASMSVKDPYLKVVVSAGGAVFGLWLVMNAAELAILLTAFKVKALLDRYIFHLERQLDGGGIVPIMMPEMMPCLS